MYSILSVGEGHFDRLTQLWEASVRVSHHFLNETDIAELRPLVRHQYLAAVQPWAAVDSRGHIPGFVGVAGQRVEMLFIDPERRGCGLGRLLLEHAVHHLGATELDVNEQNPQAVAFYRHLGFEEVGRSPLDGQGRPFPLLHMRLGSFK
ncbi:acetyltransferase [Zobellella sp. DQSA1]|uniref:acetyltransferase n=1 Tax=Zobellella sp. DQSA1 TaxID=3342386 RepID=UPI0035BFCF1E